MDRQIAEQQAKRQSMQKTNGDKVVCLLYNYCD